MSATLRMLGILAVVAWLYVMLNLSGFTSRLLSGTAGPMAIGAVWLLSVALILFAAFADETWWDTSKISRRRLIWFFLLSVVAGFAAWSFDIGGPGLERVNGVVGIGVWVLVYYALIALENRRGIKWQRSAPSKPRRNQKHSNQ